MAPPVSDSLKELLRKAADELRRCSDVPAGHRTLIEQLASSLERAAHAPLTPQSRVEIRGIARTLLDEFPRSTDQVPSFYLTLGRLQALIGQSACAENEIQRIEHEQT